MRENERYTAADCSETGYGMSIDGKVIVVGASVLPDHHPGQLFYCTGGFGANPNPSGRSVFAVSLSTGEHCRWYRNDVLGVLKPELLPDSARLYLSQIRPGGARDVQNPEYSGGWLSINLHSRGIVSFCLCSVQNLGTSVNDSCFSGVQVVSSLTPTMRIASFCSMR